MTRVLLAGLYHETHCFVARTTALADFTCREGVEVFANRGSGSQIAGFLDVADEEGWDVVPTAAYSATPSGIVDAEVFERFWSVVRDGARATVPDAVFLSLHGAMVTTALDDVEGELLERLRALPGYAQVPIYGVFDLHANFTPRMAALANGLVCYRCNPHTDAYDSGRRAARLLARAIARRVHPRMRSAAPGVIWPPLGTATAESPMRELEALARQIEAVDEDIWAVNVVGGFGYADVHDAGVSFSLVTSGSSAAADAALAQLADLAWSKREAGLVPELDVTTALERAAAIPGGPILLVEPSDNIGAGAAGDGTGVLRALLSRAHEDACVILCDPEAVATLGHRSIGERCTLEVGGKASRFDPGPVKLDVILMSRSNGHYEVEDAHSHLVAARGRHIDMGPCAVVRHDRISVLLTSRRSAPWDLGQLRSQGLEPTRFRYIALKSAVAHRQAYDPIAAASFLVSTPGECPGNLTLLPYRRLRPGVFPVCRPQ